MIPQHEWDQVRLDLLKEVASLPGVQDSTGELRGMLTALTRAFDRPIPVYSVYRQLNSFKAGQWPLLKNLIASGRAAEVNEEHWKVVLLRATEALQLLEKRRDDLTDKLDIEMTVLKRLLEEIVDI